MNSARRGILESRGNAVAIFMIFSGFGAWSWYSITASHFARDPIYLCGVLFAIFITLSLAWRSSLPADRITFGAVALAFVLDILSTVTPFSRSVAIAINGAKASMLTIA